MKKREEDILVRKLGSEKKKDFDADVSTYIDLYIDKAKKLGYIGKLKFSIEKGRVIILADGLRIFTAEALGTRGTPVSLERLSNDITKN